MPDPKLFHDDPTLDRLDTAVIDAGETDGRPWVRLSKTIFHPEGGGQPADRGTIAGVPVVDVRERGDEVLHYLERSVAAGPVEAVLDRERRFDLCQQHTAQHLLTATLLDRHGLRTTAFHLGDSYVAIEVAGPSPDDALLREAEAEANARIREDRAVRTRWAGREELDALGVRSRGLPEELTGPVRLVDIEGIDLNTCGGTHVTRLSQLQAICILDASPARGGTRIRFLAGNRVLRRLHEALDLEDELKARLGTGPEEFVRVLELWGEEKRAVARRLRELEAAEAGRTAEALAAAGGATLGRRIPGASPEILKIVAAGVLERRPDAVVVLVGGGEAPGAACFLVQAGAEGPGDVSAAATRLRDALGAKGGGRGRLFQGGHGTWDEGIGLSEG